MKVGIALNMPCQAGRPDTAVIEQHLQLSDLAEPLGFDSLLALEHHFTVYAMSPAPLQLLSYFAGRTRGIHLGTLVIVIPWHDPIRIAEQIAQPDVLSDDGACSASAAAPRVSKMKVSASRHMKRGLASKKASTSSALA